MFVIWTILAVIRRSNERLRERLFQLAEGGMAKRRRHSAAGQR